MVVTGQDDFVGEVLELAKRIVELCERDGQCKQPGQGATSEPRVSEPSPKVVVGNH
jgi:hypothetical protein